MLPNIEFTFFYHPERKYPLFYHKDTFFPLSTVQFEGNTFKAPNNPHDYLTAVYGDYMSFPESGIIPHSRDISSEIESRLDRDLLELRELEQRFMN